MTKNLYRVGIPRITETTNRFDCGRHTGGLGTGIYTYRDLSAAKEDGSYKKGKQPILKINVNDMCKNPLNISEDLFGGSLITDKFNKAGREMRCGNIKEATENLMWVPEIVKSVSKNTMCGEPYTTQCEIELEGLVGAAIKKERDCSMYKGKETYGSKHCSQPMNHLLKDLNFDCVLPTDEAGGNSNYYGSVILKETVDKKLDRKTVGYEDIKNLGEVLKNK